ncbi:hypothetical protein STAS_23618 [Striga asiatica]|uniref:Uncharacterized protein n=1 Tax=Striga asiatica TaxID=4170 RepID=A0A5A7QRM1_STRAF|nr:hypothetical protein STAS_23618 [Striga asiatica]
MAMPGISSSESVSYSDSSSSSSSSTSSSSSGESSASSCCLCWRSFSRILRLRSSRTSSSSSSMSMPSSRWVSSSAVDTISACRIRRWSSRTSSRFSALLCARRRSLGSSLRTTPASGPSCLGKAFSRPDVRMSPASSLSSAHSGAFPGHLSLIAITVSLTPAVTDMAAQINGKP